MKKPNLGLKSQSIEKVAGILAGILADEVVLQAKTRNFHWNVTGIHFASLHSFFESQYDQLGEYIDDTAERIRQLGRVAPGNLAEFLKASRLKEAKGVPSDKEMLAELMNDHESLIRQLREDVDAANAAGDSGNGDFLTALLEGHEKMAWMLRAHLS